MARQSGPSQADDDGERGTLVLGLSNDGRVVMARTLPGEPPRKDAVNQVVKELLKAAQEIKSVAFVSAFISKVQP